ncbi:MAG: hypothetical protein AB1435_08835 [Chloroflexota bacterium]
MSRRGTAAGLPAVAATAGAPVMLAAGRGWRVRARAERLQRHERAGWLGRAGVQRRSPFPLIRQII